MTNGDKMKIWIEDTQRFQKVAGIEVTTIADLEKDWLSMKPKQRIITKTHKIIQ